MAPADLCNVLQLISVETASHITLSIPVVPESRILPSLTLTLPGKVLFSQGSRRQSVQADRGELPGEPPLAVRGLAATSHGREAAAMLEGV